MEEAKPAGLASYNFNRQPGPAAIQFSMIGLLLYSVIDGYAINPYSFMLAPPLAAFVAIGVIALAAAALVARSAPRLERAVLSLMFALVAGFAAQSLALRINAATDGDGPQLVNYQYQGEGRFHADGGAAPDLDFSEFASIWPFKPGASHKFEVTQGALGFPQLNLGRLRQELRDHRVSNRPVSTP